MRLTVVVPIYNEERNLPELCRRLREACGSILDCDWSVLFVDDGSRDGSVGLVLAARTSDPRFELIELSRNFGHQPAITAGLYHAAGDCVVVMDGDLQDPPELIPRLVERWRQGKKVVLAKRSKRADRGLRRLGMEVFHRLMSLSRQLKGTANTGVFALLDRQALDAINSLPEHNRFLPGLWNWVGFERDEVLYDRQARAAGQPGQSFRGLVKYAFDAHFSFSYRLLRWTTWFGLCVSAFAFLVAATFVLRRLLGYETAELGFTTLITAILFLGGVQLVAIGVVGEYIGRIYDEVKRRPLFLVSRTHRRGAESEGDAHGT